jgi:5-methylthioadenosine/S-adenosylhomocysteine deaminase
MSRWILAARERSSSASPPAERRQGRETPGQGIAAELGSASRILICNAALVVTMDPAQGEGPLGVIEGADVLFAGDAIVAVGKHLDATGAMRLDARGRIVLPGFVDVHNHLWQSLIRGCGSGKALLDWLCECVFSMHEVDITEEEAYAAVRLSTYDLIDTGVTTVVDDSRGFDHSFVQGNLRALQDSGLRYVYAYCAPAERFDHVRSVKATLDETPRAGFQVSAQPAMSLLPWLTDAARLAKELGVYLNVHLCENVAQGPEQQIEALSLAGAFEGKLLVNHAIHLTDEEITRLAAHDVRVAHNPLSNMRLASGIMRLPEMQAMGIKIGLGLDGGSNDTSDMFANMRAAVGLQRVRSLDATVSPTIAEVLHMATLGGARVLDMENTIGSLTPGKKADILVLAPTAFNFAPRWEWLGQIVFNGQPRNVEYVFVDGQPRKAAGRLLGDDQDQILARAENAAGRIRRALARQSPRSSAEVRWRA